MIYAPQVFGSCQYGSVFITEVFLSAVLNTLYKEFEFWSEHKGE